MNTENKESVTIVGAGPVGTLLALLLSSLGYQVNLYESSQRKRVQISERSYNLTLSDRGREALRAVGLEDAILKMAFPLSARKIHSHSGKLTEQAYGEDNQRLYVIDRQNLNECLLKAAEEKPNITLHFGHKLCRINSDQKTLFFEVCGSEKEVKFDFLFGCDGAHSIVCRHMVDYRPLRFSFSQDYIDYGYKELTMPATADGNFAMPPSYLHIWPRDELMMIALPNSYPEHTFTLVLFLPFKQFESIRTRKDLLDFFSKYFPDLADKIDNERLVHDYFREDNKVRNIVNIRCREYYRSSIMILGDAAHAMVPFYGQGMNAGFEDCLVFCGYLKTDVDDLNKASEEYSKNRPQDCHAIADLSLRNFHEIRSGVNSRLFRLRSQYIDKALHAILPRTYFPLYTMVVFSKIPYHMVVKRYHRQTTALTILFVLAIIIFWVLPFLLYVFHYII